jgi:hypothetical protein
LQENTLARDHAFPPEPGFGNALSNDAALRRKFGNFGGCDADHKCAVLRVPCFHRCRFWKRGGDMKITSRRSKLTAWLAVTFGLVATVSAASAEDWYYVNRQPAPLDIAQVMAARGLPFGYYWLQPNGNWGFEGSSDVVGNIYGRRPSLSERGRLYGPGELLR